MTTSAEPTIILCCTDFSENASRAFDYAVDAAQHRANAELHLLNVIPEPDSQFWKSYIYQADIPGSVPRMRHTLCFLKAMSWLPKDLSVVKESPSQDGWRISPAPSSGSSELPAAVHAEKNAEGLQPDRPHHHLRTDDRLLYSPADRYL